MLCPCCGAGETLEWMLGPALTHGVAALPHGPHGAPSLQAAAQSPGLLQILKGPRPQAKESEPESRER